MLNKHKFIYVGIVGMAVVVGSSLLASPLKATDKIFANSDCAWNHYNAVDSTYFDHGSKEYWVCCEHHEIVVDEPSEGTITEAGTPSSEFVNALKDTDKRYNPAKTTDHVVAIKVNSVQTSAGKFTFATRTKFANVTTITFDAKWENTTQISWISFGHTTDITTADNYTGMKTFDVANDGLWHSCTLTYNSSAEEYYMFQAAKGEFNADATLLFRNITINYADGAAVETALGIGKYFKSYFNSDYPELIHSALEFTTRGVNGSNENMALALEPNKLSGSTGQLNFVSRNAYQGITTISLKYKATGGIKSGSGGWCRFAVTDDPATSDIYSVFSKPFATFSPIFDGEWHTVSLNDIGADGYLFLGAAIGEFEDGTTFYFDEIDIGYYWNNCHAIESFNHDCVTLQNSASVRGNAWTTVSVA